MSQSPIANPLQALMPQGAPVSANPVEKRGVSSQASKENASVDPFEALMAMMQLQSTEVQKLPDPLTAMSGQQPDAVKPANMAWNPLELPKGVAAQTTGEKPAASVDSAVRLMSAASLKNASQNGFTAVKPGEGSRSAAAEALKAPAFATSEMMALNGEMIDSIEFDEMTPDAPLGRGFKKPALFAGSDFVAMRSMAQPKLKENAILDAVKMPQQSVDSIGMSQMLRFENQRGFESQSAIENQSAMNADSSLFASSGFETGGLPQSNAFPVSTSLEMTPTREGSAQQYALKADQVKQLADQIGNVRAQGAQSGEIRIRLRPDHLGELRVQIKTDGKQVSLKFDAKDDRVKAALESSMGDLRERLSSQNLSIGSFDVQVNREPVSMASNVLQQRFETQNDAQSFMGSQNAWSQSGGQDSQQRSSREASAFGDDSSFKSGSLKGLSRSQPGMAARAAGDGRIDVRV